MRKGVMIVSIWLGLIVVIVAQSGGLPEDITQYVTWTRLNAQRVLTPSAHPVAKDIYANDAAADTLESDAFPFAEGAILVKESLDPDSAQVAVISAMRKVAGFDPDNGDWQYGMFETSGDGGFSGMWMNVEDGAMCSSCHVGAADSDFAFLNYR